MAWTAPKQYKVEEATHTDLNLYQRDNLAYLHDRPVCIVTHNAAQNSTSGGFKTIAFNTEQKDTDAMHSTSTNNERINLVQAGLYICVLNVGVANIGTETLGLHITHSGDPGRAAGKTTYALTGAATVISLTRLVYTELTSTYVYAELYQDAGSGTGAILQGTDRFPYFSVAKLRDVL